MLPSSGYFRTIMCPFSKLGLCTRPHCHYKHSKQDSAGYKASYSYSSARSNDEYLPESIPRPSARVINQSYHTLMDVDCEENATYIPTPVNKCLKPVGILKTSNSDKPSTSSIPEYKPTPIAKLKELNIVQSHVSTEYTPSYTKQYRKKKNIEEYDPTEVKFVAPKKTVTFADEKTGTLFAPSEIVLSSDEDIDDGASAPKFSDDDFDDDIVVCEPPPKVPKPKDVVEIDVTEEEKIDEFSIVDKILVDSKRSEELIKAFSKPKKFKTSDDSLKARQVSQIEDSLDSVNEYNIDDKDFDIEKESAEVDREIIATNKCLELIQSSFNQLEKHNLELNSLKSTKSKSKQHKDSKESKSDKSKATTSAYKSNSSKLSDKSKSIKSESKKEIKSLDKSKDKTSDKTKSIKKQDESLSIKKKSKDSSKKSVIVKDTKSSSQSAQGKHTKTCSDSDSTHAKKEKVTKSDKIDKNQKSEKILKSDKSKKQDKSHKSETKAKSDVVSDKKHSSKSSAAKQDDKLQDRQVSSSSIVTKKRAEKVIIDLESEKVTSKSKSSPSKSSSVVKRKSIDVDSQSNVLLGDASPPSKRAKVNSSSDEAPDLDLSSDEDIDEQLWKIYNETFSDSSKVEPEEREEQEQEKKKVDQEEHSTSGKKRQAHAAAASLKKPPITKVEAKKSLNPAQVMHNRYTQLQTMYAQSSKIPQSLLSPARNNEKKRISFAPNPGLIAAVQQKKMLSDNPNLADFTPLPSTVTKTLKTTHRVAHIPDLAFKPRPIIPADFGSKVPVNVRQKFLNAFIDECLKFCSSEDEAYEMGLDEEKKAYERSSSKPVYMNVAANTLKRLRDRVSQKSEVTTTTTNSMKSKNTVSHEMVINGPIAQRTSFSVGKKKQTYDIKDFGGAALYEFLLSYILTEEQLKENGYPFPHPFEPDRAVIEGIYANRVKYCNDAFKRTCSRCQKIYYVNVDGDYVRDEECEYHWGRIWKRRIAGAIESRYNCCQGDSESDGCCVAPGHVFEGSENHAFKGFVKTLPKTPPPDRCYGVYSLDCEMCYTTAGSELTRITVIGTDLKPVYESFVKPQNKVLDYNTRFSGITEENLQNVRTTLHDVQAVLLCIFNDKTILIGHSLESDFKALKLFHKVVIDTSVVFPHKNGLPFKRALRTLMAEKLNKIIQNDVGGHDSHEDAAACMELMLYKIQEDLKSNR